MPASRWRYTKEYAFGAITPTPNLPQSKTAVVLNLFGANAPLILWHPGPAAAPCGPGTVTLGTATTHATPAMPRERMNEWPGNHGHRGPGNADSTKTDRTQRPNKAYIFVFEMQQPFRG
ncbi:unnamed protein product [Boreogadus saida]